MQKTNIEWTDYTWNPIKGICPIGCWYCYARKMYKRFGWNPEIRLELNESILNNFLNVFPKRGDRIFLCSTFELFHPVVKPSWRDEIFKVIEKNPHYTFQILTKFPQNIDRPMPGNVWIGITVEDSQTIERTHELLKVKASLKFVSFEPLLGMMTSDELDHLQLFNWIIVGMLTGHGKDYDPARWWVAEIEDVAKEYNIPLFLKNNLKDIWEDPLIQEMPE